MDTQPKPTVTKCVFHFVGNTDPLIVGISGAQLRLVQTRMRRVAQGGRSSEEVRDYAWDPYHPRQVTVNLSNVTHIVDTGQIIEVPDGVD